MNTLPLHARRTKANYLDLTNSAYLNNRWNLVIKQTPIASCPRIVKMYIFGAKKLILQRNELSLVKMFVEKAREQRRR